MLTPLAVDPGHPFPYVSNLSLSLAVLVRDPQTQVTTFARADGALYRAPAPGPWHRRLPP